MNRSEVLVVEISGKRPGDSSKRQTERFAFDFDKVIISNNSEGYETDWDIINVPDDYVRWYKDNVKTSDLAFYAPMNRSYAIKYARDHGYKYLVQLDDNIIGFDIRYTANGGLYATSKATPNKQELPTDMICYLIDVLENTNAGMAGMPVAGVSMPSNEFIMERYVYSVLAMKLSVIPDYFQGDFEDDIEFRLKLKQMNIPVLSVTPFRYMKTSQKQGKNEDSSGNRAAYIAAGVKRGEHMSELYGEYYSAGISSRGSGMKDVGNVGFRHKLKPYKVGARVSNIDYLKSEMLRLLEKYATPKGDELKVVIPENAD